MGWIDSSKKMESSTLLAQEYTMTLSTKVGEVFMYGVQSRLMTA